MDLKVTMRTTGVARSCFTSQYHRASATDDRLLRHSGADHDDRPGGGAQVLEQQIAIYAAISSAFEKSSGGADFGFAVDSWSASDFATGFDPANNPP